MASLRHSHRRGVGAAAACRSGRWLLVAAAAAAVVLLAAFAAPGRAREAFTGSQVGLRATPLRRPKSALAARGGGASVLDELIDAAEGAGEDKDKVNAVVEENFGRLKPQDMAKLQTKVASDPSDKTIQMLVICLQESMDKRMSSAAKDLGTLLASSGDIEANIRDVLAKQDSPLPIMTVLQMNLQKAAADGDAKMAQAMEFVFSKMNAELEKSAPPANKLLGKVLQLEGEERKAALSEALAPGAEVAPEDFASALVDLVPAAKEASEAGGAGATTLSLLRDIGKAAGVLTKELHGPAKRSEFIGLLKPLFEEL